MAAGRGGQRLQRRPGRPAACLRRGGADRGGTGGAEGLIGEETGAGGAAVGFAGQAAAGGTGEAEPAGLRSQGGAGAGYFRLHDPAVQKRHCAGDREQNAAAGGPIR